MPFIVGLAVIVGLGVIVDIGVWMAVILG